MHDNSVFTPTRPALAGSKGAHTTKQKHDNSVSPELGPVLAVQRDASYKRCSRYSARTICFGISLQSAATSRSCAVIGLSLKLFHLGADNQTQKFRISIYVSDTVVITGRVHSVLALYFEAVGHNRLALDVHLLGT